MPNTGAVHQASLPGIEMLLMRAQLRWTGHVLQMGEGRLLNQLFFSELALGTHTSGGQSQWYKNVLKGTLGPCSILGCKVLLSDRDVWRRAVSQRTAKFKQRC